MRKFIIQFDHQGFLFSAKVLLKRDSDKMILSTTLINKQLAFILEEGQLMFMEHGKGFQLLLFKKDRSFEILKWTITSEFVDRTKIVDIEAFSLS